MQLHYTIWVKGPYGDEPLATSSPAGMTSSEQAREDAQRLIVKHSLRARFLTIEDRNGDGSILEEWLWVRGKWKPMK
jgi:hypothetical protein